MIPWLESHTEIASTERGVGQDIKQTQNHSQPTFVHQDQCDNKNSEANGSLNLVLRRMASNNKVLRLS